MMACEKASEPMNLHTGVVLYLTILSCQSKPGLIQETNLTGLLKIHNMHWITNEQPKLVVKNYLKKAMLNHARIRLQTLKKKNKKQIIKVIKHSKMNPYNRI